MKTYPSVWRNKYGKGLEDAISFLWSTRTDQKRRQKIADTSSRSAVEGGKQTDGFADLMRKITLDMGVPPENIHRHK